jgi:hypothetical protein
MVSRLFSALARKALARGKELQAQAEDDMEEVAAELAGQDDWPTQPGHAEVTVEELAESPSGDDEVDEGATGEELVVQSSWPLSLDDLEAQRVPEHDEGDAQGHGLGKSVYHDDPDDDGLDVFLGQGPSGVGVFSLDGGLPLADSKAPPVAEDVEEGDQPSEPDGSLPGVVVLPRRRPRRRGQVSRGRRRRLAMSWRARKELGQRRRDRRKK